MLLHEAPQRGPGQVEDVHVGVEHDPKALETHLLDGLEVVETIGYVLVEEVDSRQGASPDRHVGARRELGHPEVGALYPEVEARGHLEEGLVHVVAQGFVLVVPL
ncbi:hypothetical protein D4R47_00630, partial [archaeon]